MNGPRTSSSGRFPRRVVLAVLVVPLLALALAPVPQDRTAPFPRHGAFVGRSDCVECHEAEEKRILSGAHQGVVTDERMQSCETCHGPGKAHANDQDNSTTLITFPPKLGVDVQQRLCGRCHATQIERHGGDMQGLIAAGKKCTDCHKVHTARKPAPYAELRFATRTDTQSAAKPAGGQQCVTCHPRRNELLDGTGHAKLMAAADGTGCEQCHGQGSLHVETGGLARLITRPDRARDGIGTCRQCHTGVDGREFHWKDRHKPLLSGGMRCTTCHEVHRGGDRTAAGTRAPAATTPSHPPERGPSMQQQESAPALNSVCAKCHAPAYGVMHNTIHAQLGRLDVPLEQGCGGCHEGALAHARSGGRRQLVESMRDTNAASQLATCAKCHGQQRAVRDSRHGSHQQHEVACLACHSPAAPRGRVAEDATKRCATCHAAVAAEFRMPNHHPIDTGRMTCVDCHDPHSARPRVRDRQLREARCVECHKQYRGPFVFAHQASRIDGCVVCHVPHGSSNRRMLRQADSQQNCLQCHGDFPSFHDQTKGAVFTNCLNCHTEVHGSNHSRFLFR